MNERRYGKIGQNQPAKVKLLVWKSRLQCLYLYPMSLYIPKDYRNLLQSVEQTEKAIKAVKDMFQVNLSAQLALLRVTAPMMVLSGQGLNDDLNGVERPVKFPVKSLDDAPAEVVHSLAKWKRLKLAQLGIEPGRGIYTDMNALRPDEDLDNLHSIYVDQWDWEKVMLPSVYEI